MMRRVILDTDILSEVIKKKNPVVLSKAATYAAEHGRFSLTSVTEHEILFGLQSKGDVRKLATVKTILAKNEVIVPTAEDFVKAAEIRGKARQKGRQVALDDTLIASVAVRLGLPVSTGNTEHFRHMQETGLPIELENWREP